MSQSGDIAEQRLLEHVDPEPRFAGTGHAENHAVGGQCAGLEQHRFASLAFATDVELAFFRVHQGKVTPADAMNKVIRPRFRKDVTGCENDRVFPVMREHWMPNHY